LDLKGRKTDRGEITVVIFIFYSVLFYYICRVVLWVVTPRGPVEDPAASIFRVT
jgi:hypothetical protein